MSNPIEEQLMVALDLAENLGTYSAALLQRLVKLKIAGPWMGSTGPRGGLGLVPATRYVRHALSGVVATMEGRSAEQEVLWHTRGAMLWVGRIYPHRPDRPESYPVGPFADLDEALTFTDGLLTTAGWFLSGEEVVRELERMRGESHQSLLETSREIRQRLREYADNPETQMRVRTLLADEAAALRTAAVANQVLADLPGDEPPEADRELE